MDSPLRIGLAGLGTVGASLARLLSTRAQTYALRAGRPIKIVAVSARDRSRDRGVDLSAMAWFDDPVELASKAEIDLFVELVGGSEGAALASVKAALNRGIPVVTANKALLAHHGVELAKLGQKKNATIFFEAAAAGGIPIIKTMREALRGNAVHRVYGILNGTCNYMLTRMEKEGIAFDDCLADAQRLGYAEADPTFDIGGFDAAHKLALLTSLAFGCEIDLDSIFIEGISSVTNADIEAAAELGYRIKLLAVAQRTDSGIEQRVHPTMIPAHSALAQVDGVTNAVAVDTDLLGSILLVGPGAGGNATASAVLSDVLDMAKGVRLPTFAVDAKQLAPYKRARMRAHEGGYYIRLSVLDRVGAFASIARRMAENDISLESIVQRKRDGQDAIDTAPVILITHETTEAAVKKALDAVSKDGHLKEAPRMIRIEALD
ncbi:homoserine dehydrogenase [Aureimonas phyllosphaerae]|uniref:Homoserine dehydrogenase n=1 Tax=Aureimonas phyllosphaerae TaxID=1166078 RepID=A0A7W6BS39_9HYPH|nr:homoserine dehydrogenase [Aureimonas phyllosphaerae]MBB3935285.1 homoserine dehydrogenase [Aureimonas phyllosphaerae]MBB3959293.1 homoserine dehydrogenase [Aureimonas phyllosphaerae]SFF05178.1 homoserine dehydrogenase [Aureimonas phyllosphaerae]